jgi:hypothetical protein
LLAQFLLQGCEVLHRSLSETILLATSFKATLYLTTQRSPLREIAWLEFWAMEVVTLAGNRSDHAYCTAYDEAR